MTNAHQGGIDTENQGHIQGHNREQLNALKIFKSQSWIENGAAQKS